MKNQVLLFYLISTSCFFACSNNEKIIEKWENGFPKKVHFDDGHLNYEKNYYETGELQSEGALVDDLRMKEWKFYHPNGNLKKLAFYKDGKPFGETERYYEDNILQSKGKYDEMGQQTSRWIYKWKNGNHKEKGDYEFGLRIGLWKYYNERGAIEREEILNRDEMPRMVKIYNGASKFVRYEEYHPNNVLKLEEVKLDTFPKRTRYKLFYNNGQLREEGLKISSKEIGVWNFWYSTGNKMATGQFYEENISNNSIDFKNKQHKQLPTRIFKAIKIGKWLYWDEQGEKIADINYSVSKTGCKEKINYMK